MEASPLQALALVSIVLFSVVGTVMGIRLLLLARRTGEVPELALGLCLVMIATFGYPLSIASALAQDAGVALRVALFVGCAGTVDVGIVAALVFTQRVFRRDSGPARAAVWAGALALATILALNTRSVLAVADPGLATATMRPLSTLFFAISAGAFGWSALESATWWSRLRRRVTLGLADPVVANRFALWTLWGVATSSAAALNGVYTAAGATIHHPVPLLVTALCGFLNAATLFLAFFAPAGYVAWVERRAAVSPA